MPERALDRHLKRMKIAVRIVVLNAELAELRERALPPRRVDQIGGARLEEVVPFASGVSDPRDEAARQLLLDIKIPVLVIQVVAKAIDPLGAEAQRLKLADEGIDRKGQIVHHRRGKRVSRGGALVRVAEIVVLVRAEVNAESRAEDGLSAEARRRPCQAEARSEVVAVGRIIGRARRAEA